RRHVQPLRRRPVPLRLVLRRVSQRRPGLRMAPRVREQTQLQLPEENLRELLLRRKRRRRPPDLQLTFTQPPPGAIPALAGMRADFTGRRKGGRPEILGLPRAAHVAWRQS